MADDVVHPKYPFSVKTFELLAQLKDSPLTKNFYSAREEKFKPIENPFKQISNQAVEQLPAQIKEQMGQEPMCFGQSIRNTLVYYNTQVYNASERDFCGVFGWEDDSHRRNFAIGKQMWRNYNTQVAVEFPSPKTALQWKLTSQGWVGHIPLTPEFHLELRPKVQLSNLFHMLEYAYQLKSFRFLDGLIDCQSLEDFYTQLAYVLAQRILDRGRNGFYRAYLPKTGQLAYIQGRVDVRQAIQKPWDVKLSCHYEELTADVEENQILAWTLFIIGRSGLCTERVLPKVRQAYHALQGCMTLKSCSPEDCVGRLYNRLNEDYRPLHALCRFFLENTGPSHERGDRMMLPFLIDMARLYELFVAEWLKENPPQGFFFKQQQLVTIDQNQHFRIDLILCDVETGAARYVLDTKYKVPDKAAIADIHEMVSYATATRCYEAVLVYPKRLTQQLDVRIDHIRVRSLTFSLDGNLDQAGNRFLLDLLPSCPVNASG